MTTGMVDASVGTVGAAAGPRAAVSTGPRPGAATPPAEGWVGRGVVSAAFGRAGAAARSEDGMTGGCAVTVSDGETGARGETARAVTGRGGATTARTSAMIGAVVMVARSGSSTTRVTTEAVSSSRCSSPARTSSSSTGESAITGWPIAGAVAGADRITPSTGTSVGMSVARQSITIMVFAATGNIVPPSAIICRFGVTGLFDGGSATAAPGGDKPVAGVPASSASASAKSLVVPRGNPAARGAGARPGGGWVVSWIMGRAGPRKKGVADQISKDRADFV